MQSSGAMMAQAIASAINSAGCPEHTATYDGGDLFSVFYPEGKCLCISDTISGDSFPLSTVCGLIPVCNNAWYFEFLECPTRPQPHCIGEDGFSQEAVQIDFDELPSGLVLSDEFPGVVFENTRILASSFAVSTPNVITYVEPDPPGSPYQAIRITFDPPVLRVGCNIDSDGFEGDRQPQLRLCGVAGSIAVCDFGQGPDFRGIELPECERIIAIEIGGTDLATCGWRAMDGFDNLLYETALCGDIDGNREIDLNDVAIFVEVLLGLDEDLCHWEAADINMDGMVDGMDIQPFVNCVVL